LTDLARTGPVYKELGNPEQQALDRYARKERKEKREEESRDKRPARRRIRVRVIGSASLP
jgi:hypothetical protein